MRSPYNPSAEDVEKWAFDPESLEPEQDWDLILSHEPFEDLYMRLATSPDCPKQDYFLAVLYLIVGDAVRTKYRTKSREDIDCLLSKAQPGYRSRELHVWVKRSRQLMANPETFDYAKWCAGGLARTAE